MYNKTFHSKPWTPEFDNQKEEFKLVHVWVKIGRIPSNCWNWKGINDIAIKIGIPIRLDGVTANMIYSNYARVLMEKQVCSYSPLTIEMLDMFFPRSRSIIVGGRMNVQYVTHLDIPLIIVQGIKAKRKLLVETMKNRPVWA